MSIDPATLGFADTSELPWIEQERAQQAARCGLAVTGALNQHREVLPVGGINEKIEGWFRVWEAAGPGSQQGMLIPERNRRHLMLEPAVVNAVAQGRFHIHTARHIGEGLERMTGVASGLPAAQLAWGEVQGSYPPVSVLGRAEQTLRAYRRACQLATNPRRGRGNRS